VKCFGIIEITDSECELIEKKTRGQSKNKNWSQECRKCLHASNFGRVYLSGSRINFANLAKTFTVVRNFSCAAVNHVKKLLQYKQLLFCMLFLLQAQFTRRSGN